MSTFKRARRVLTIVVNGWVACILTMSPGLAFADEINTPPPPPTETTAQTTTALPAEETPPPPQTETSAQTDTQSAQQQPLVEPQSPSPETTTNEGSDSPTSADPSVPPDSPLLAPANTSAQSDPNQATEANTTLENNNTSSVTTGDIAATHNRTVGDSTTGDATAVTNIVNVVQSQGSLGDESSLLTFTRSIEGDVKGDILIDPSALSQPSADIAPQPSEIPINIINNQNINNTLNLDANSGNVTLSDNRRTGDVATGSAEAVANIINLLNSAITADKSFLGIINIYGNLDGDILLPAGFIDSLAAENTASTPSGAAAPSAALTVHNQQSITNNIRLSAVSGSVSAVDTRRIGNVSTGTAATNLTLYNLTSTNIIGNNVLLVFVNVLGQWAGFIVDAPAGSTSAALGGNTTTTTLPSVDGAAATNASIYNDITVSAVSGSVNLTNNRRVGNVSTGNATASANVLNIVSSQLSLAQWFGVLFINVFGSWNGSFGVNTAAGDPIPTVSEPSGAETTPTAPVFQFIPHTNAGRTPIHRSVASSYTARANTVSNQEQATQDTQVLPAATQLASTATTPRQDAAVTPENGNLLLWIVVIGTPAVGYGLYRVGVFGKQTA